MPSSGIEAWTDSAGAGRREIDVQQDSEAPHSYHLALLRRLGLLASSSFAAAPTLITALGLPFSLSLNAGPFALNSSYHPQTSNC
jgi:hypothetical protein